ATSLLYVPGMIWFVLIGMLWYWKRIDRLFKKRLTAVGIGAVLVLAAIAPLGWAVFHNLDIGKQLLGLPVHGWPSPISALGALIDVPLAIMWRGPLDPVHWLGRLPLVDVFTLAMFGLGLYTYGRYARLGRSTLTALILVLGSLLIALGGGVTLSIIVPFVYIVAAVGTDFMLEYWYRIFPRNIIAQGVGALLLSFAIIIAVWYNLRHYYVAWPNAPETRAVFTIHKQ
ncbi:MAG TPA: hypothetical protein VLF43_04435, partial [Candidatus Saccharimonadales bacterium]|nr:hypothetical protein [Candidatus Saccharimonadales bacterium]